MNTFEKEITRVLDKMIEMEWITVNPLIRKEALPDLFVDIFREVKLKDYLEIFDKRYL